MILLFVYTHDELQKAVKLETSLLAERQPVTTKEGTTLGTVDEMVMDEEYDVLFRRLFDAARAELVGRIPANYLTDTPTDLTPLYKEFPNFSQDRDFSLWLAQSDEYPTQYNKSMDVKLTEFLVNYICFRWLEKMQPQIAALYAQRADTCIMDVKNLLMKRNRPIKRWPSFP